MHSMLQVQKIRHAAVMLRELIDTVGGEEKLNTSQVIGLYFWLIDHEHLHHFERIHELIQIVMSCLERQLLDGKSRARLTAVIEIILAYPDSGPRPPRCLKESAAIYAPAETDPLKS
jgi:hypothetical protein